MFVVLLESEVVSTNRTIYKEYDESLKFSVILSKAYNLSNYVVYALNGAEKVLPTIQESNVFIFENIQCNMEIFISNISLNYYSVVIDGEYYGNVSYGSWIYIEDSIISVRDVSTNIIFEAMPLLDNSDFYGWVCENDEDAIYQKIKDILDHPDEIKKKTNNLKNYKFDNKSIKEKYDRLIGE